MNRSIFGRLGLCLLAATAVAVAVGAALFGHPPAAMGVLALQMPTNDQATWAGLAFGGLTLTPASMAMLNQGFKAAFKNSFELVKPMWPQFAMDVPSTTSEEKYAWLGATTKLREWIGDRVYQNLKVHGYAITNKDFESTVAVPRNAIDDDQYGVYTPLMSQMGQDAALHPDELLFGLLGLGFSTNCYDGQYFFDVDHPVGLQGKEVSVSNMQAGAGPAWYLLDTSKVLKPLILQRRKAYQFVSKTAPTDDNVFDRKEYVWGCDGRLNVGFGLWQQAFASKATLDMGNYAAARTAMMNFKADNGKPLAITPKVLLVSPTNEKAALDVVMAERLANGATNTYRNTAEVVVCPWLT
ncbi:MAG: Mu-like prophage major head subunit gpT family protein [Polaromonas sp.]